ncbi:plasmid mobilization protein [Azospirillum halopraeferens]|uniref:plasmid mobilization protein n=1 Tax=Azospirillum halopraeferens TaxID=34010 RepID=UPI0004900F21|nr:hypothetical protein [Azospirillum halopraeferens]
MVSPGRRFQAEVRNKRLKALVNGTESAEIEARANAARMSISAFVRAAALGEVGDAAQAEALRQFDEIIAKMERSVNAAVLAVDEANRRMEAMR